MTGPDPQALDRVARFLCKRDEGMGRLGHATWATLPDSMREYYRSEAGYVFNVIAAEQRPTPGLVEAAQDWRIDAWEPVVVAARDARHLLRAGQTDEALDVLIAALDRLDAALKQHDA